VGALNKKIRFLLNRYCENESGSFTTFMAVCMVVFILCAGILVDLTLQMSSKSKAQDIADSISLASAIYVSQTGQPPTEEHYGFLPNVVYDAKDLGYDFPNANDVSFEVVYDNSKREARVEIQGNITTNFMQIAHFETLDFAATSTAKYREIDNLEPASIAFVMDNSGSMWFDDKPVDENFNAPPNTVRRIDALKSTLANFNTYLGEISSGSEQAGERFLRTGLLPYNHDIITGDVVSMHWGVLDEQTHINAMTPGGATNSSPPIAEAWNWLQSEPAHHLAETQNNNPLRFVIFMTDGNNTEGTDIWVPEEGTGIWRRIEYERVCWSWWCWWVPHYVYYNEADENNNGQEPSGSGWEEGRIYLTSDVETMNACEEMKNHGVQVYTIGFALEAGTFATNDWSNSPEDDYFDITPDTKERSSAVLAACASSPENFLIAEDAEALQEAFNKIGNNIIRDVIRIAN